MSLAAPQPEPATRLAPWTTWPVTIRRVRYEAPQIYTYDLAFEKPHVGREFRYLPGQFNMLYVPGVGEAAISIAGSTADGTELRHTIRSTGAVTNAIEQGGMGMQLGLRGPFGVPWPTQLLSESATPQDVIIVAGGVGLAPLRRLVQFSIEHRQRLGSVTLLVGARTPEDIIYEDELELWKSSGIELLRTVDRPQQGWSGHVGVVTLLLERLALPNPDRTLVMTCGPEVMMRYVAKSAQQRGIPAHNLWLTLERHMNCAIGLCGHCQLGPAIICRDGPVFRYDRIQAWLRVQEL